MDGGVFQKSNAQDQGSQCPKGGIKVAASKSGSSATCVHSYSSNVHDNASHRENVVKVASSLLHLEKIPLKDSTNLQITHQSDEFQTPTKPIKRPNEPVTPTANLKLLTDLASRETLFKDKEQKENHSGGLVLEDIYKPPSRKEKSLGLLCIKFLERYPEYPPTDVRLDISLDEASKDLNVERRRIYDIVNVLESVQIVRRCATNLYTWLGKTHLKVTLARLKATAEYERIGEQIDKCSASYLSLDTSSDLESRKISLEDDDGGQARKEKSLGMMSQKFIMLFLVSKPQIVNLNLAARILIGNSSIDYKKSTAYKTKIRRLYDIANILTSIQLIQKVHVNELCGRKPAFQYIGPEIDDASVKDALKDLPSTVNITRTSLIGTKRPFSQSSLNSKSMRVKLPRTKSENFEPHENSIRQRLGAKTLIRHPSLQDVCMVAEEEWRKLSSYSLATKKGKCVGDVRTTLNSDSQAASSMSMGNLLGQMFKSTSSTAVLLTSNGKPVKVIAVSSPITIASSSAAQIQNSVPTDELNDAQLTSNVTSGIPALQCPLIFKLNPLGSSNMLKISNDGQKLSGENRESMQTCESREQSANAETGVTAKLRSNTLPSQFIIFRRKGEGVPAVVNPKCHSTVLLLNGPKTKSFNGQVTNVPDECIQSNTTVHREPSSDLQQPSGDIDVVCTNTSVRNVFFLPLDASLQCNASGMQSTCSKVRLEQQYHCSSAGTPQDMVLQMPNSVLPVVAQHNSSLLNVPFKCIPSTRSYFDRDDATPAGPQQRAYDSRCSFSPIVKSISTPDATQAPPPLTQTSFLSPENVLEPQPASQKLHITR